jgi:hypothetical protein
MYLLSISFTDLLFGRFRFSAFEKNAMGHHFSLITASISHDTVGASGIGWASREALASAFLISENVAVAVAASVQSRVSEGCLVCMDSEE